MSDNLPEPGEKYEGWTESEKAVDIFFELTKELAMETFKEAAEMKFNSSWFLNGRAAVLLENLQKKREILRLLQEKITGDDVLPLVQGCLKKADGYIREIETKFRDPQVRKNIKTVRENIRKTVN